MSENFIVSAPAKINVGLRVLPKRNDGFHDIESIFQTVSLSDRLEIQIVPGNGVCTVECAQMVLPEKNTLTMAYDAFCNVTGCAVPSVKVLLEKHIPSGGGLGGGSSDAAALIRALGKMNGIQLTGKQLDEMASVVGSDVFFFTHCDPEGNCCAVVTGRGEKVRVIQKRNDLHFVLVFPGVHSSTKEAYCLVDKFLEEGKDCDYPLVEDLEKLYNLPVGGWEFRNTFSDPLVSVYPEIGDSLKKLRSTNPLYSEMSGSGSTIYGVYASGIEAEMAARLLNDEGLKCVVTQ